MDLIRGRVVRSRAGRDKDTFLVVVSVSGNRVLLADGGDRPLARPKAKNIKHVSCTGLVLDESAMASDKLIKNQLGKLNEKNSF